MGVINCSVLARSRSDVDQSVAIRNSAQTINANHRIPLPNRILVLGPVGKLMLAEIIDGQIRINS